MKPGHQRVLRKTQTSTRQERRAVQVCPGVGPSLNTYPYEALTDSQPLYETKEPTGKRANPVPGLTQAIAPTQYQGRRVPRARPSLRPKALILEAPLVTNQMVQWVTHFFPSSHPESQTPPGKSGVGFNTKKTKPSSHRAQRCQ